MSKKKKVNTKWPCQWCMRWTCELKGGSEVACPVERGEALPDELKESKSVLKRVAIQKGESMPQDLSYEVAEDKSWIKCLNCGKTSYNTMDVEHLYCGHCHRFHN